MQGLRSRVLDRVLDRVGGWEPKEQQFWRENQNTKRIHSLRVAGVCVCVVCVCARAHAYARVRQSTWLRASRAWECGMRHMRPSGWSDASVTMASGSMGGTGPSKKDEAATCPHATQARARHRLSKRLCKRKTSTHARTHAHARTQRRTKPLPRSRHCRWRPRSLQRTASVAGGSVAALRVRACARRRPHCLIAVGCVMCAGGGA
jgi:hypothetical protein